MGRMIQCLILVKGKRFFLPTGSGATRVLLNGCRVPLAGVTTPPSSAEVNNEYSFTVISPICLHGDYPYNFTFTRP